MDHVRGVSRIFGKRGEGRGLGAKPELVKTELRCEPREGSGGATPGIFFFEI